jgi:hypothetical protein
MTHRDREILQAAHDAGVVLNVEGDRLLYRAPPGALTPELRAALAALKPDLVCEYHERAGILEYDANMPREVAERRAADLVLTGHCDGPRAGKKVLPDEATPEPLTAKSPQNNLTPEGIDHA